MALEHDIEEVETALSGRGHSAFRAWLRIKDRLSETASAMGAKGGAVKSEAKREASRDNGAKGGRPRTKPHEQTYNCIFYGCKPCGYIGRRNPVERCSCSNAMERVGDDQKAACCNVQYWCDNCGSVQHQKDCPGVQE